MDELISEPGGYVHDKDNNVTENKVEYIFYNESVEVKDKSTTSDDWKIFMKIGVCVYEKERTKCNGCNKICIIGSKRYGTFDLKRQVERCRKIKYGDISQTIMDV